MDIVKLFDFIFLSLDFPLVNLLLEGKIYTQILVKLSSLRASYLTVYQCIGMEIPSYWAFGIKIKERMYISFPPTVPRYSHSSPLLTNLGLDLQNFAR